MSSEADKKIVTVLRAIKTQYDLGVPQARKLDILEGRLTDDCGIRHDDLIKILQRLQYEGIVDKSEILNPAR